jgi:hypothetical protein
MMLAGLAALLLSAVALSAQGPVTNRMPASTMRGTVVEIACFREHGAATVSDANQIACAKTRLAGDGRLGILTEGDGLFQITGRLSTNKYAKLAPFIGQRVDMSGAEVVISNNYDYRSFEAEKVERVRDAARESKK